MKKAFVIHPFLFTAFPILFLFAENIEQVSYVEILLPLVVVLGLTILAVLLSGVIFRNGRRGAAIVSISLVLFFSYGRAYDLVQGWRIAGLSVGRHMYLLIIWAELLASSIYWLPRSSGALQRVTKILNVVAVALVGFSLLNVGLYEVVTARVSTSRGYVPDEPSAVVDGTDGASLPDVYYIVLDGYADSRTLREVYGYDNGAFIDALARRGFTIARHSRSNYPHTFLSLASSLNMQYVNDLAETLGAESEDRAIPYRMIKDNQVLRFLESKGYTSIHFSSGWGPTFRNPYADVNVPCGGTSEFTIVLLRTTMLRPLERDLAWSLRERVLCTFSRLGEMHTVKDPKFVFAHIMPPHPPYLFNRDGEPISGGTPFLTLTAPWEKEAYVDQLVFVNKKVLALLDEILSESSSPPIIILQADHGPAFSFDRARGPGWTRPTDEMLLERTGILNAYHLPGDGKDQLYDSITPVNTFRLIFSSYFGADHAVLDDKIYFSGEKPYRFVDVTDRVIGK